MVLFGEGSSSPRVIDGKSGRGITLLLTKIRGLSGRVEGLVVPDQLRGARVQNMIKENGQWNEVLIRESLLPCDAVDILNIPLSRANLEDEIIWAINNKGKFSEKSAYHLAVALEDSKESSASGCDYSKSF